MTTRASNLSLAGAALFAGAAAWALQQQGGYIAVSWVCGPAASRPVWLLTAGALILLAVGTWLNWRALRPLLMVDSETSDLKRPRRLLGLVGLMGALLFLFTILLQAGAAFFLPGCVG
jgi:hypothetical protein